MGEIGIDRKEYLYELTYCDTLMISRGYVRRYRNLWSATRWHAFNIMSAIPYCDLRQNGIFEPTDLIKFPWERSVPVSDEEVEDVLASIEDYNRRYQACTSSSSQPSSTDTAADCKEPSTPPE